jgi:hypothetical protein
MGTRTFDQFRKAAFRLFKGACPRWLFLVILLPFFGCAELKHMDEALMLKAYSDDKDSQAEYVAQQDKRFEELLALARSGKLSGRYSHKSDFLAAFGDPILTERIGSGGRNYERLLYRYTARYFDVPKVYVVFDDKENINQVSVLEPEAAKPGQ